MLTTAFLLHLRSFLQSHPTWKHTVQPASTVPEVKEMALGLQLSTACHTSSAPTNRSAEHILGAPSSPITPCCHHTSLLLEPGGMSSLPAPSCKQQGWQVGFNKSTPLQTQACYLRTTGYARVSAELSTLLCLQNPSAIKRAIKITQPGLLSAPPAQPAPCSR